MQLEWNLLKTRKPESGQRVLVSDGNDVKLAVFNRGKFISNEVMYQQYKYPYWLELPKLPKPIPLTPQKKESPPAKTALDAASLEGDHSFEGDGDEPDA